MSSSPRASTVPADVLAGAGFAPSRSTGLFVGVSRFADPRFDPIPYAVDDAVDLAHLFSFELGLMEAANVVLALAGEPVKDESKDRLGELLGAGAVRSAAEQTDVYRLVDERGQASGTDGLFVCTLATHGFSDQGDDYLVAADSLRRRIERTGIAVAELFDDVSRTPAPRRLVLLDACRERMTQGTRAAGEAASAMSPGFVEAIARARGQAILTGTTLGGYSYDDRERRNGVFTATLIAGLRGAAPANEHAFITVRTLADWLDGEVAAWVRRHASHHAELSRGIERRLDGSIVDLPLAINPRQKAASAEYRERRDAALARLRENLGEEIPGALYDRIAGFLSSGRPLDEVEPVLEEVEALDGTRRLQRALASWFEREHGTEPSPERSRPPADPPPRHARSRHAPAPEELDPPLREAVTAATEGRGGSLQAGLAMARSILADASRSLGGGADWYDFRRGLEDGTEAAVEAIRGRAISDPERDQVIRIASEAAGGDREVGLSIALVLERVGTPEAIATELAASIDSTFNTIEASLLASGLVTEYLATDSERREAVLEDARVLLFEGTISDEMRLLPVLEEVVRRQTPLLIVAGGIESGALSTLVVNHGRGVLKVAAVKAPGRGEARRAILEDLGVLTRGRSITKALEVELQDVRFADLGRAAKVIVTKTATLLVAEPIEPGSERVVTDRVEQIDREIETAPSESARDWLRLRRSLLNGGAAIVRVGGADENRAERRHRYDRALAVLRSAFSHGVVEGVEPVMRSAAEAIRKESDQGSQRQSHRLGVQAVCAALERGGRQLAQERGPQAFEPVERIEATLRNAVSAVRDLVSARLADFTS